MVKKYNRKLIGFLVLIVFIIGLVTALYFLTPEEIVDVLGVRNAYLLAFVVAFFGGFSAWSSFAFIATLATLSIGGLNPIILGLVAGISLAIGDGIMFYLGSKGRELIIGKWKKRLDKVSRWTKQKVGKAIPFIAYLYIGLTPFPNDHKVSNKEIICANYFRRYNFCTFGLNSRNKRLINFCLR